MNALLPVPGDPIIPRRKLDVGEYHRMGEVGILTPEDRVELIEGELIDMAPIGPEHAGITGDLTHDLVNLVGDRALVRVGLPVRLDANNEPQPDLALLMQRPDRYRQAHPTPADVLLLIEISHSSVAYDRTVKLRLYGSHGIAEYWIVNIPDRVVEVCRKPNADGYASIERFGPDAELEPQALPGVRLRLNNIFA